jgi:hypothetical protein
VSSDFLYESGLELYLAPLTGVRAPAVERVFGPRSSSLEEARRGFHDACNAAIARRAALFGINRLELASCGKPEDLVSSGFLYFADLQVSFVEVDAIASEPPPIAGEGLSSLADGLESWESACHTFLEESKVRDGERLVGAVCGVPENKALSGFRYVSQPTIWHQP